MYVCVDNCVHYAYEYVCMYVCMYVLGKGTGVSKLPGFTRSVSFKIKVVSQ